MGESHSLRVGVFLLAGSLYMALSEWIVCVGAC